MSAFPMGKISSPNTIFQSISMAKVSRTRETAQSFYIIPATPADVSKSGIKNSNAANV
jgi:hypothetical protein